MTVDFCISRILCNFFLLFFFVFFSKLTNAVSFDCLTCFALTLYRRLILIFLEIAKQLGLISCLWLQGWITVLLSCSIDISFFLCLIFYSQTYFICSVRLQSIYSLTVCRHLLRLLLIASSKTTWESIIAQKIFYCRQTGNNNIITVFLLKKYWF